jgi:hypothetical protein
MKERLREFHIYKMLPAAQHLSSPIEIEGDLDTGVRGSRIENTHEFVDFVLAHTQEEMFEKTGPTDVVYDSQVRAWFYRGLNEWVRLPN